MTAVVVPSLVVAMRFARRGSVWAQLSTTSLFAYLVYTYAYYLSGTGFNDLFLLQVGFPTLANVRPDLVILPAQDPTAAQRCWRAGAAMARSRTR